MIDPYSAECEDVTTIGFIGTRLSINIPEDLLPTKYQSNTSLRINSGIIATLEEALNRIVRFANVPTFEILSNLLSQPAVFRTIPMLLERANEFMETIDLRRGDDFQFDISRWIDDEVEGWNYFQFKVTLLGPGIDKLLNIGMDKFALLKNLITMAGQMLPQEVRQEVVVLLE